MEAGGDGAAATGSALRQRRVDTSGSVVFTRPNNHAAVRGGGGGGATSTTSTKRRVVAAPATYFLVPGSDMRNPYLRPDVWLHPGTRAHYIVIAVGLAIVGLLVLGIQLLNHTSLIASSSSSASSLRFRSPHTQTHSHTHTVVDEPLLDDNDPLVLALDVHQALRDLLPIEPVHERLADCPISWQRVTPHLREAVRSHPHVYNQLYAVQPERNRTTVEKGLVLLLHGCTHAGRDWYELPEERRIVRRLLAVGYSTLAFTSIDRESGCWNSAWPVAAAAAGADESRGRGNSDVRRVLAALRAFLEREYASARSSSSSAAAASSFTSSLTMPPLFILGGSSGGTFATVLSRALPTVAQVIHISPGHEHALTAPTERGMSAISTPPPPSSFSIATLTSTSSLYPIAPSAFIYMSRDPATPYVLDMLATMRTLTPARAGRVALPDGLLTHQIEPLPLTPTFLADRIDAFHRTRAHFARATSEGDNGKDGHVDVDEKNAAYADDNAESSGNASSSTPALADDSVNPASTLFFELARELRFLDARGYLVHDPRTSGMLEMMVQRARTVDPRGTASAAAKSARRYRALGALLTEHAAEVQEELNMLYAQHELSSEYIDEIVQWFERQRLLVKR